MITTVPLGDSYKWRWMMHYCKNWRIPPAQEWAWTKAEIEFNLKHSEVKESD